MLKDACKWENEHICVYLAHLFDLNKFNWLRICHVLKPRWLQQWMQMNKQNVITLIPSVADTKCSMVYDQCLLLLVNYTRTNTCTITVNVHSLAARKPERTRPNHFNK